MRRIVTPEYGGPDVLQLDEQTSRPSPHGTNVLVEVEAVGVCGHDLADRAGLTKLPLPHVLGHEIAGRVIDVGPAVTHLAPGDRVAAKQHHTCGWCTACRTGRELDCTAKTFIYGGYADCLLIEQDALALIPDNVTSQAAAVAACAVGSCVQALSNAAHLRHGETVLVTGAGGGLGIHALQVAASMGARVIALTSSASKTQALRTYGAHEVVVTAEDPGTHIKDLTRGLGVDVVLDNVGLPTVFDTGFKALAQRGRYVLTGQLERQKISLYPAFVFFKEAVITGSASTSTDSFLRSLELLESGHVRAVTTTYALDDVVAAHRDVEKASVVGRAVLVP